MVADRAGGHLSASEIRRDLRKVISSTGYRPPEGKEGTLQDLYSKRRLDTIIRTNVEQARGYVRHLDGMKPGAFAAFPGQELIRVLVAQGAFQGVGSSVMVAEAHRVSLCHCRR